MIKLYGTLTLAEVESTYTLPGPVIAAQALEVQYSDTIPYIRLICSKKDIAAKTEATKCCIAWCSYGDHVTGYCDLHSVDRLYISVLTGSTKTQNSYNP